MEEIWMMAAFSTPIALLGSKLAALFSRGRTALVRRKMGGWVREWATFDDANTF